MSSERLAQIAMLAENIDAFLIAEGTTYPNACSVCLTLAARYGAWYALHSVDGVEASTAHMLKNFKETLEKSILVLSEKGTKQ
jgi:hypothetical protein